MRGTPEQRFWAKVNKGGPVPAHRPDLGPCWLWTGAHFPQGYAALRLRGRPVGGHWFAYFLLVGPPPPPHLELDHLCWNRGCVNPYHLEPVPHQVNTARGKARITHCPSGHAYTAGNLYHFAGSRVCRTCHIQRVRAGQAAERQMLNAQVPA